MRLLAIGDVHVEHRANRDALVALPPHPDDWLVLAGDVSESIASVEHALDVLRPKFAQVVWVPGNHELWTVPRSGERERGEARYDAMVAACRARGVLTPEDEYVEWPGDRSLRIAPLFVLYDYSFAPDGIVGADAARAWAAEDGIVAADEALLHPDPHPSIDGWCRARIARTVPRLEEASRTHRLVLVNHWPLRRDLVRIPRVPRYVPWCGTRVTEDWHVRYRAEVVVSGHLHVRATDHRDGVRFEEVSLGYPRDWDAKLGAGTYLRRIL
ncbi:metallophosphoesterase family protein [Sandaracinus amylolyticus]|uniref:metallophosphoesterase family protein n=1 Tax=Sandaracinus amylolyticus TaxID=927083 RepID=UPI00069ED3E8|nr:metallophosphoesterase [Sandaracinus amylolyticus]